VPQSPHKSRLFIVESISKVNILKISLLLKDSARIAHIVLYDEEYKDLKMWSTERNRATRISQLSTMLPIFNFYIIIWNNFLFLLFLSFFFFFFLRLIICVKPTRIIIRMIFYKVKKKKNIHAKEMKYSYNLLSKICDMYVYMLAWKLIALAITVNVYHNRRIGNL